MDKSAKVEAAPAVVAPAKVAKKGKRDAEVAIKKNLSSKTQKRDVDALKRKNVESKTQKKPIKKQAAALKKFEAKTQKEPINKQAAALKKFEAKTLEKKHAFISSDEDSSESDDEPKNAEGKTNVRPNKVPVAAANQADSSSDDSKSDDSSSDEDAKKVAAQPKKTAASIGSGAATKKDELTDDSDESSDDDVASTKVSKKDSESDEDASSEEEEGTDEEDAKPAKTPKKSGGDVEMVDAEADGKSTKKAPQTAATPQAEGALKTLLVRLPFQFNRDHMVEFFKDAGKVVDVHFHVEFATEEAAQKAARLNEVELLGRAARLHWAREVGAVRPHSGEGKSIFIRGFDESGGEDEIRSALQEHFGSCGEIESCNVMRENYTGKILGLAFITFSDSGACAKALELNKSELGGYTLRVREAYPRAVCEEHVSEAYPRAVCEEHVSEAYPRAACGGQIFCGKKITFDLEED